MTAPATRAAAGGLSHRRAAAVDVQAARMVTACVSGHRLVAIDAMLRAVALGCTDATYRAALAGWVNAEMARTEHAVDLEDGRPPAASAGAS